MEPLSLPWPGPADLAPYPQLNPQQLLSNPVWLIAIGVGVLLFLLIVGFLVSRLLRLFSGKRQPADPEGHLREDLADYPPPPGSPGPRRLEVQGYPARIRLVVIAPVGKAARVDSDKAEPLLEHVLRGLGDVARQDRPRVRIWPPQLSHAGFAVKFHRLTDSPDPDGRASRWTLLAGQARVGPRYILLGMALWTDEKTTLGRLTLDPERWTEVLRVVKS